ncbi:MAG: SPOR domain-containing protein [Eubacteriales bacterium]|nr:SPOR domain-containing protein [Eubacteriales bacterium]
MDLKKILNIIKKFFTNNPCLATGATCKKIGIQIHTIGCAQGTAQSVYNSMNNPGYMAGVHYLVDSDVAGKVLQTMPETIRSWADGGYGNDHLITIEICESDYMSYAGGASFSITNSAAFRADITRGYQTAVLLCADICKRYGWNPQAKLPSGLYLISSHDEGRRAGLSTAHVDPTHVWEKLGFTMDKFRADVKAAMGGSTIAPDPQPAVPDTKPYYYKVQAGAFKEKTKADKLCTELKGKGFDAFVVRIDQYYKVQVGNFTVQANAEKLMNQVKAAGYPAFVTKTTSSTTYNTWVGKVNADKLNVRTGPGTNYGNLPEYPTLASGNLVDVIGESGEWYQIKIAGKYKGYVHKNYITQA